MENRSFHSGLLALIAPLLVLAACGDSLPAEIETATVVAEVRLAPADARCIQLKTVAATTVTQSFDVAPQATSVLMLKGLPAGSATITAAGYNVPCASVVAATVATYVSDPVTVTVTLAAPVNVSFVMRPNLTAGQGTATIDFPTRSQVVEFVIAAAAQPNGITAGPDGNVWFAERGGNKIGRITPAGSVTEYPVPTAGASPTGIVTGGDGNLWFAENGAAKIGRISPTSGIAEFVLPAGSVPRLPVAGADGNVWFLDSGKIGRITPWGQVTTFPAGSFAPADLTACTDGNLWYTSLEPSIVGRITPAGVVTTYPQTFEPGAITCTPDGKVWVVEGQTGLVAQGTTAGFTTGITHLSTGVAQIADLVPGPDGAPWFVAVAGAVGRVAPFAAWATPRANVGAYSIAVGPDGALWFTQAIATNSAIGRLLPQ